LRRPRATQLNVERLEERCQPAGLQLGALPPAMTVLAGDFNGDGLADVARLSASGIWQVGTSQGRALSLNFWGSWGPRPGWAALLVGDFNGDGKADVAGLSNTGRWIVGLSTGQQFRMQDWGSAGSPTRWSQLVVGDFNGDGRADLAGLTARGNWQVELSTGRGFQARAWANWGSPSLWAWVGAGDVNGDGKTDVIGLSRSGAWTVGLSTGQQFQSLSAGSTAPAAALSAVEVGDFNGDGKADVAALSRGGRWLVGLSDGTQFHSWAWGSVPAGWEDTAVGDVNGDGKADLVTLGRNGTWTVNLSQGSAFATDSFGHPGRPLPGGVRLLAGDFNGDRAADAAYLRPDGNWQALVSHAAGFVPLTLGTWPLGLDAMPYRGDVVPYAAGAPWDPQNAHSFIDAQSPAQLAAMDFNSAGTYKTYVESFYGVLHSWVTEADLRGIRSNAALTQFLGAHLQALFPEVRGVLARAYPGLSDQSYRLLMAMNLAHGDYLYATTYGTRRAVTTLLHLKTGDCTEIADLEALLVRAQGIPARIVGQIYSYQSPAGYVGAQHVVAYAGGLWLDAEINTAFQVDLAHLAAVPPYSRLPDLLSAHRVYGFYNWYLQPQVRAEQLARGLDGGILGFYYLYYFAGFANGNSQVYFERGK